MAFYPGALQWAPRRTLMPRSLLVLVICFVVSVGFAQSAKSSDTRPPLGHRDPGVNLAMGRWRFVTVMCVAVSPLSRSQPYLKFDERKHTVTGLTGCNRL